LQDLGGTSPQFFSNFEFNPASAFTATATPENLTAYMTPEQTAQYSRIQQLLGKPVTTAAAAPTTPFQLSEAGKADLENWLLQSPSQEAWRFCLITFSAAFPASFSRFCLGGSCA
jgi:hypothetical protein